MVVEEEETTKDDVPVEPAPLSTDEGKVVRAQALGSREFREDYNVKYAYVTGAMYKGVASKDLVVKMGKAGMIGYLGAGGLKLEEVEESIQHIQKNLNNGQAYGVNLLHNIEVPELEEQTVDLFLRRGITKVEAAAYMQMTSALVRYRLLGLKRDQGSVVIGHKVLAKVSRPEVAELFLSPAPERIVKKLLEEKKITAEQAELSKQIPMADDLCAEADSGGHTDQAVAFALLPAILKLRDEMMERYGYRKRVRVGAAGGIGTPEAAAAAFVLGADFILTGSINQCTVEAGTSDAAKDLLESINVQDTSMSQRTVKNCRIQHTGAFDVIGIDRFPHGLVGSIHSRGARIEDTIITHDLSSATD